MFYHVIKFSKHRVQKYNKKLNHKNTELRGKSIQKVHNHMAKSNNKTHKKTNGQELSYSWLGTGISNVENGGLNLVL